MASSLKIGSMGRKSSVSTLTALSGQNNRMPTVCQSLPAEKLSITGCEAMKCRPFTTCPSVSVSDSSPIRCVFLFLTDSQQAVLNAGCLRGIKNGAQTVAMHLRWRGDQLYLTLQYFEMLRPLLNKHTHRQVFSHLGRLHTYWSPSLDALCHLSAGLICIHRAKTQTDYKL